MPTGVYVRRSAEERFWPKVDKEGPWPNPEDHLVTTELIGRCWQWRKPHPTLGYGFFFYEGKTTTAHRVAWKMLIGEIPDDYEIDHLCRNRACVNPDHLEPVSGTENKVRGAGKSAAALGLDECQNGHPLSGDNMRFRPEGGRACRTCRRWDARMRRAWARDSKLNKMELQYLQRGGL